MNAPPVERARDYLLGNLLIPAPLPAAAGDSVARYPFEDMQEDPQLRLGQLPPKGLDHFARFSLALLVPQLRVVPGLFDESVTLLQREVPSVAAGICQWLCAPLINSYCMQSSKIDDLEVQI